MNELRHDFLITINQQPLTNLLSTDARHELQSLLALEGQVGEEKLKIIFFFKAVFHHPTENITWKGWIG